MQPTKTKVWAIPGSHGYWKVVDITGTALMTGLDCEGTARRWAQNERRNLELQEGKPPTLGGAQPCYD